MGYGIDNFDFKKILNQMVLSLTLINSVLENPEGLIKIIQNNLKGEKAFTRTG